MFGYNPYAMQQNPGGGGYMPNYGNRPQPATLPQPRNNYADAGIGSQRPPWASQPGDPGAQPRNNYADIGMHSGFSPYGGVGGGFNPYGGGGGFNPYGGGGFNPYGGGGGFNPYGGGFNPFGGGGFNPFGFGGMSGMFGGGGMPGMYGGGRYNQPAMNMNQDIATDNARMIAGGQMGQLRNPYYMTNFAVPASGQGQQLR